MLDWKRRFEQYIAASGLSEDSEENTLLCCMGEEAEVVLRSTGISLGDRKVYEGVCKKLDEFFKVSHNVIFERACFNKRNQPPGESVEQYIMKLYKLVENCNYGNLTSEMTWNRLVVGIQDGALSEKTSNGFNAYFRKTTKQKIRQRDAVHVQ